MASLPSYDSSKVASLSLTPGQLGLDSGGVWADQTLTYAVPAVATLGLSFDFSISTDSERSLSLAPVRPFTAATDDLAGTGETADTWDLTLTTDSNVKVNTPGTLYAVVAAYPDDWSNSNLPSTALATAGSTFLIEAVTSGSDTWVFGGGVYSLVWELDFLTNYTETVNGTTLTSPLACLVNHPRWNGKIQFILDRSGFAPYNITAITFAGYTHKWHTGLTNVDIRARGRAVHDYITGQPYLSHEAVADGYRDGIMVHPDNYDPPDPNDTDYFTPPPGEGVTDDEVNNLE